MKYVRSQHYEHACVDNPKKDYLDRPISITGASGSGKSTTAYNFAEDRFEYDKYNAIFLTDLNNEYENCFPCLKATYPSHLEALRIQHEEPESKPTIIHACFCSYGLKSEMKLAKKRYGDNRLPDMDFFLIDAKSFRRAEGEFLLESSTDKSSINLLMHSASQLSNFDGIYEFEDKVRDNTEKRQTKVYDTVIDESELLGDKKDEKEIKKALRMLKNEKVVVPKNFKVEVDGKVIKPFDIMDILNKRAYHSFVFLFNEQDDKHRMFLMDYILNELDRHIKESHYPLLIVIDETDLLTPYTDSKGFNGIFAYHLSKKLDKWRKAGVGVTVLFIIHRYRNTDDRVKGACKEKWFHELEDADIEFLKKVHTYKKHIIGKIEGLKTGEFIVEGEEYSMKPIKAHMPKHGHKHGRMKFEAEYRKQHPDKLMDYTSLVQKFDEEWKKYSDDYNLKKEKEKEKRKQQAKKEFEIKMKKEKKFEELKEYKDKSNQQKIVDKKSRDDAIIETYNRMKLEGGKVSYRSIAKELNNSNIKCSYVTVKNVLEKNLHQGDST